MDKPYKMDKSRENGFTLVEVLVALVIFSTAILGLLNAGTKNIQAVSILEQKQIAGIVADNQLILAMNSEEGLKIGTQTDIVEMDGRKWSWRILTEATEQVGFFKLTINVNIDGFEQVIISRIAFVQAKTELL